MSLTTNTFRAEISETQILRYFQTFNAEHFEATAALFAPQGALYPPFEVPIVGPDAIASYLKSEALGMTLNPRASFVQASDDGMREIQVTGNIQTPAFSVNVSWNFLLDREQRFLEVRIKLQASPQELLGMRQRAEKYLTVY